jgi:aspartate racemase
MIKPKKTVGLVGGIGPESTVDYYREIISRYRARLSTTHYPLIIINSVNMTEMLSMVERGDFESLCAFLLTGISSLHRAGATFAAIASNTPHIVFHAVRDRSPLPLISIVESVRDTIVSAGYVRCVLLGTAFTMNNSFYKDTLGPTGIDVIVPEEADRSYIHETIFSELEFGIVKESTKQRYTDIIQSIVERHRIDSVLLGCTELPLLFKGDTHTCGIPLLDAASIHIDAIVNRLCT